MNGWSVKSVKSVLFLHSLVLYTEEEYSPFPMSIARGVKPRGEKPLISY